MRLRPYKSCDAKIIASWIQDEEVFQKWGGERFGAFPIVPSVIDDKYLKANGDCIEPDNFFPWTALDEEGNVVGHFIMRYTGGDPRQLRFGWVIVDSSLRGKGIGRQMLTLGAKYAFDFLGADRITIGVYENNEIGHVCYQKVGFKDTEIVDGEPWKILEMEYLKEDYLNNEK